VSASSGFIGCGVFKSTDGGKTFTRLEATKPSAVASNVNWANVNAIAAHPTDPNKIYAGTNRGLWVTEDGGATWANDYVSPSTGRVTDVKIHKDGTTVISLNDQGYVTPNGSKDSFVNRSGTGEGLLPTGGLLSRIEFAIAPSNSNRIY